MSAPSGPPLKVFVCPRCGKGLLGATDGCVDGHENTKAEEVEVIPVAESEERCEAVRAKLAHGGEPDISAGDDPETAANDLEDTEEQSDLRPRSAIALVAGRLEGYADGLDQMARLERTLDLVALAAALREDAEKLKQSGGGEDR